MEICEQLLTLYSQGSRINRKREYVLLLASCMIDWYSILRERTSRSWTRKVKNLFECFVSDKSGDVTRNQQLSWKLDICKMKSAIEQNDINLLYSCSIVKKIYLEKQLVYALYNKNRKKLYVGRTNNLLRRLSEHLREAVAHKLKGKPTQRVHSYMAHNDLERWGMIPIFATNNTLADSKIMETRMIKAMNPNRLLNDDFHTRARNARLQHRTQSIKRPGGCSHRESKCSAVHRSARQITYEPLQFVTRLPQEDHAIEHYSSDLIAILDQVNIAFQAGENMEEKYLCVYGSFHRLVNWTRVRLLYGRSQGHLFDPAKNEKIGDTKMLSQLLPAIKKGKCYLKFDSIIKNVDAARRQELERMGKSENVARKILRKATLQTMLELRANIHLVQNRKLRNMAACSLDKALKIKYKLNYSQPIVVRVPYSPTISLHAIRKRALRMVDYTNDAGVQAARISYRYRELLKRRLRVVPTKRKTISECVSNFKNCIKSYKHTHGFQCVCQGFPNLPKVGGHVAFKATDVNNGLIQKCLHVNSKNMVEPTHISVENDINRAFGELRETLCTLHARAYKSSFREACSAMDTKMEEYLQNEDHLNYGVKPTGVLPTMHDIIITGG